MEITFSVAELHEHLAWLIDKRVLALACRRGPVQVEEIIWSDDAAARLTVRFTVRAQGTPPSTTGGP